MTDSLFNPEAFEQMPGQMSMAAVESTFAGTDAPTCSECERSLTECDCIVMEMIDMYGRKVGEQRLRRPNYAFGSES